MSHTYQQLIEPGSQGDSSISLNLTARQVAIIELILDTALEYGIGALVLSALLEVAGRETTERARLEFDIAQKRIGIAMCRVMGEEDRVFELTADLALLDGEVAGL